MESNVFFFEAIPGVLPLGKFQHNINISIKTARVSRLSVSYDCDFMLLHSNYSITNDESCSNPLIRSQISES